MLTEVESNYNQSAIISFFSHGRAFGIHKPKQFETYIMPKYFKHTRFTSFQRQLNLYGFHRITKAGSPDNGGYFHEMFLRGRLGLIVNMRRTKVKGMVKCKHDPDTEPNFYAMDPCPCICPPSKHSNSTTTIQYKTDNNDISSASLQLLEFNHPTYHNSNHPMQQQQSLTGGPSSSSDNIVSIDNLIHPMHIDQTTTSTTTTITTIDTQQSS